MASSSAHFRPLPSRLRLALVFLFVYCYPAPYIQRIDGAAAADSVEKWTLLEMNATTVSTQTEAATNSSSTAEEEVALPGRVFWILLNRTSSASPPTTAFPTPAAEKGFFPEAAEDGIIAANNALFAEDIDLDGADIGGGPCVQRRAKLRRNAPRTVFSAAGTVTARPETPSPNSVSEDGAVLEKPAEPSSTTSPMIRMTTTTTARPAREEQ